MQKNAVRYLIKTDICQDYNNLMKILIILIFEAYNFEEHYNKQVKVLRFFAMRQILYN